MSLEKQQQIMGYFIEEARDHLHTIEQGVLNLQDTITDPEGINEVFRAAHSIKGGAAMLGVESIQHVAHRLEDFFNILRENPDLRVDERLTRLLLDAFDGLQELLDRLQEHAAIAPELARATIERLRPVFAETETYLKRLTGAEEGVPVPESAKPAIPEGAIALFQQDVPAALKSMLELFRQGDNPSTRQQLQEACNALRAAGDRFNFTGWCRLIDAVAAAVGNTDASYRELAPIAIKELKQAQDLVLNHRAAEIEVSAALQAFVPLAETRAIAAEVSESAELSFEDVLAGGDLPEIDSMEGLVDFDLGTPEAPLPLEDTAETFDWLDRGEAGDNRDDLEGPVVGQSELHSLATLFDSEAVDLDLAWDGTESGVADAAMGTSVQELREQDEFADFFSDSGPSEAVEELVETGDRELAELFGDRLPAEEEELANAPKVADWDIPAALESPSDSSEMTPETALGEAIAETMADESAAAFELAPEDAAESAVTEELADFFAEAEESEAPGSAPLPEDTEDLSSFFEALEEEDDTAMPAAIAETMADELAAAFELAPEDAAESAANEELADFFAEAEEIEAPGSAPLPEDTEDLSSFFEALEEEDDTAIPAAIAETMADESAAAFELALEDAAESAANEELADFFAEAKEVEQRAEAEGDAFAAIADLEDSDLLEDPFAVAAEEEEFLIAEPAEEEVSPWLAECEAPTPEAEGALFAEEEVEVTPPANLDEAVSEWFVEAPESQAEELPPPAIVREDEAAAAELADFFAEAPAVESAALESAPLPEDTEDLSSFFEALEEEGDTAMPAAIAETMADESETAFEFAPEVAAETAPSEDLSAFFADAEAVEASARTPAVEASESVLPEDTEDLSSFFEALEEEGDTAMPAAIAETVADETAAAFEFAPEVAAETAPSEDLAAFFAEAEEVETTEAAPEATDVFDAIAPEPVAATLQEETEDFSFIFEGLESSDEVSSPTTEESGMALEFEAFEETAPPTDADELADFFGSEAPVSAAEPSADPVPLEELFDLEEEADAFSETAIPAEIAEEVLLSEIAVEEAIEQPSATLDNLVDFFAVDEEAPASVESEASAPSEFAPEDIPPIATSSTSVDEFDELEAILAGSETDLQVPAAAIAATPTLESAPTPESSDSFAELEALLEPAASAAPPLPSPAPAKDEFSDLEELLRDTYMPDVGAVTTKSAKRTAPVRTSRIVSQTMKVDVKHLDSLNNLVGELVVNRNLLEQDQERLQQFISNLLHQVQLLSDVSQRMRDQYDRSLLENSLLASRSQSHLSQMATATEEDTESAHLNQFDALEMDRFSSFHTLSQEIIELIVRVRESASDIEFVVGETEQVSRQLGTITTQIQDDLKQLRMVPFAQIADRLPRAVRDIAFKTGKQADLEIYGRETLIDKAILEQLYDPMTHLVNNAIVHGIEDASTRQGMGKPPIGKIIVRAYHQGNQTVISVSDDGAGIDLERVKRSALAKGVRTASELEKMTETEVYGLLFEAGFSTRSQADELAGRGVGLDVVSTALTDIRGTIHTESSVGHGTTFTIRLPLTLSISKAMFCISDRARIAFPVDGFEDMVEVPQSQIQSNSQGQPCLPWRDTVLPFQPLSNLLKYGRHISRSNIYGRQDDDVVSIIILRNEGNYLALQVDQFLGESEIVIKQLEGPIPKPPGIAGATVLGDGRVMAIANVLELFDIANGRLKPSVSAAATAPPPDAKEHAEPTVLIVDDSITVRELLSMTFAKVGYRVEQARDGQDAWEKLRAGLPCDLIFCDIEMPRMDGLDFLSRVQKDQNLCQIPVAMLTSRGADRHRQTAIQLGAKGYFTKPYLEEELLSASQRLLKGESLVGTA